MIISHTEFDLLSFSVANALKGELRSQASACFIRIPPTFGGSFLMKTSGLDGSRTHVQKPFHRSSTIIADYLTFPLTDEKQHPSVFSSFMLLLHTQSFVYRVPYKCRCLNLSRRPLRSDSCN